MKIRRKVRVLAVLAALTAPVMLAGCTPGEPANGEITLTIQHSLLAEEARAVLADITEDYTAAHPEITFDISYVPWADLRTATLAKATSGEVPDISYGSDGWGQAEFTELGLYRDISEYMSDSFKEKFSSSAFDAYGPRGLPFSTSFEAMIFYRADIFEENGITPPAPDEAWTWDEFTDVAKQLTQDTDGDGKTDLWGFAERGLAGSIAAKSVIPYALSYGTDAITGEAGNWKANLQDPAFVAAVDREVSLMTKEGVAPSDFVSWGVPEAADAWNSGRVAMMNIGSWFAGNLEGEYGVDYDVMLFPTDEAPTAYISQNWWSIAEESEHPQEAFDFLEYLYDPDRLQSLAAANNNAIPSTLDAQQNDHYSADNYPMWAKKMAHWQPYLTVPAAHPNYISLWSDDIVPFIQSAWEGSLSVDDALAKAQEQLAADLAK